MSSKDSIKKVDIFINGHSYSIYCPTDEEPALQRATSHINKFIQDIRKNASQLSQEELLVLCSLNLYEKSEELQHHIQAEERAKKVLTKIIADAQSLINDDPNNLVLNSNLE